MDSEIQITEEQRDWLSSLSPVELIDVYCEGTLKILEDEHVKAPIDINIQRNNITKEHQTLEISLVMASVIAKLKVIGMFYSKINNTPQINNLDYGLKLFLNNLTQQYKYKYFSEEQYTNARKLIVEYILDDAIGDIKKFTFVGYENIPHHDMMFLLHEFAYRSPIHQNIYNFQGEDIRRTLIGRIEITTVNKYQDYKLNIQNIENQLLNGIRDFAYNIQEIVDIIFVQKEVQYRLSVLNELYFNFEHFLSVLIKTFRMNDETLGKKKITKKQGYLARVFDELDIKHHIDYSVISKEIESRCVESSSKYLKLFKQNDKQKINLIEIFLKIIDMRNSLHANGSANKDTKEFSIAKIHFSEVKKDEQFSSMAMHQLVALLVISSYTMELIIQRLFSIEEINGVKIPDVMVDEYVENIRQLSKDK